LSSGWELAGVRTRPRQSGRRDAVALPSRQGGVGRVAVRSTRRAATLLGSGDRFGIGWLAADAPTYRVGRLSWGLDLGWIHSRGHLRKGGYDRPNWPPRLASAHPPQLDDNFNAQAVGLVCDDGNSVWAVARDPDLTSPLSGGGWTDLPGEF
jgi:hypothetical protein